MGGTSHGVAQVCSVILLYLTPSCNGYEPEIETAYNDKTNQSYRSDNGVGSFYGYRARIGNLLWGVQLLAGFYPLGRPTRTFHRRCVHIGDTGREVQ